MPVSWKRNEEVAVNWRFLSRRCVCISAAFDSFPHSTHTYISGNKKKRNRLYYCTSALLFFFSSIQHKFSAKKKKNFRYKLFKVSLNFINRFIFLRQVPPLRFRVYLKSLLYINLQQRSDFTLPKDSELEPHYRIQLSVTPRILFKIPILPKKILTAQK